MRCLSLPRYGLLLCIGLFVLACATAGGPADSPKNAKPEQPASTAQPAMKPVSIPKEEIYTTSSERGFKEKLAALFLLDEKGEPRKPRHSYSVDLEEIRRHHGASNIFLVSGKDLTTAIRSTKLLFVNGFPADSPPDEDFGGKPISTEKCWLVVYLGRGQSGPSKWTFKSCVVAGNTVEFAYEGLPPLKEGELRGSTTDTIQYFYWVPLPELKKGPVELKLVDARRGRPMLTRSVDNP
jgi:hypothetical protein